MPSQDPRPMHGPLHEKLRLIHTRFFGNNPLGPYWDLIDMAQYTALANALPPILMDIEIPRGKDAVIAVLDVVNIHPWARRLKHYLGADILVYILAIRDTCDKWDALAEWLDGDGRPVRPYDIEGYQDMPMILKRAIEELEPPLGKPSRIILRLTDAVILYEIDEKRDNNRGVTAHVMIGVITPETRPGEYRDLLDYVKAKRGEPLYD